VTAPCQLGLLTQTVTAAVVVLGLDVVVGYAGTVSLGHATFIEVGDHAAIAATPWLMPVDSTRTGSQLAAPNSVMELAGMVLRASRVNFGIWSLQTLGGNARNQCAGRFSFGKFIPYQTAARGRPILVSYSRHN
jgi:ABC-type branched-subunit amino acid transport system permease subunit